MGPHGSWAGAHGLAGCSGTWRQRDQKAGDRGWVCGWTSQNRQSVKLFLCPVHAHQRLLVTRGARWPILWTPIHLLPPLIRSLLSGSFKKATVTTGVSVHSGCRDKAPGLHGVDNRPLLLTALEGGPSKVPVPAGGFSSFGLRWYHLAVRSHDLFFVRVERKRKEALWCLFL